MSLAGSCSVSGMSVTVPCLDDDAAARRLSLEPSDCLKRVVCLQLIGAQSRMVRRTRKSLWTRCGPVRLSHNF